MQFGLDTAFRAMRDQFNHGRHRTMWRVLAFALAGLGAIWLTIATILPRLSRGPEATNVVLITIDTLRANRLGVYGYAKDTSPNLDRFARQSIVFQKAYAHAPATVPSLGTLMTSQYPHEIRVYTNVNRLQKEVVTLAEILLQNGFRTGAVVSNPVLERDSGFDQGFEDYDHRLDPSHGDDIYRIAPNTTETALSWLKAHRRSRFFLWVHYMEPHGPYTPPPPFDTMFVSTEPSPSTLLKVNDMYDGRGGIPGYQVLGDHRDPEYYRSRYDGLIRFLDHSLGVLFDGIRDLGLMDNTLVIVTADHGEGLGEHDYFFDHTDFVYEEMLRVPLILRLPGQVAGREVGRMVGLIEVLPEILHLTRINTVTPLDGTGLLHDEREKDIYAETFYHRRVATILSGGYKLIDTDAAPMAVDHELYDLTRDPGELQDLLDAREKPQADRIRTGLANRLEAILNRDDVRLPKPQLRGLDEEGRQRLKSLGYTQ